MIQQDSSSVKDVFAAVKSVSPTAFYIWWLIASSGRASVNKKWVQEHAGLAHRVTAEKYLQELLDAGWLEHPSKQRWCLPKGSENAPFQKVQKVSVLASKGSKSDPFDAKGAESEPSALTTTTTDKVVVREEKVQKVHLSEELEQALREAGIGSNAWDAILEANPELTPDCVRRMHIRVFKHEHPRKRNVGFLIHCLSAGDDAPDVCLECEQMGKHAPTCSQYEDSALGRVLESTPVSPAQKLWQQSLNQLALQMTRETFDTWLAGTRALNQENGVLSVEVDHPRVKEWLDNRLGNTVQRTVADVVGHGTTVQFVVRDAGNNHS